ncbi:transposase [Heyndrickxia sporothermodurans]|uniref:transposase n=1 Tax=Heyndrickxia sporothermodurans TaxID=46224 RepID=UPI001FD191E2|nr:transposase [Heyndrickxia sporothermodurans]MEB6548673.1 transposase [Heyndrickxia sporothermodurans]
MPRKPRIWFEGAKYHITSRGIRRSNLFFDDQDRSMYLYLLREAMGKFPFKLYTYCLMTNHIHLQIETIKHPPGEIMKQVHTKYAKYFNKRYDFTGHVFESRYGAEQIDRPDYELEVNKYIHLNPIRANIVQRLEDYPWSSYRTYIFGEENSLVFTTQIFSYFKDPLVVNYEKYLHEPFSAIFILPTGKIVHLPREKPIQQRIKKGSAKKNCN